MRKPSKTDWERVRADIDSDAPIAFDPEDELYDPNHDAAVETAWAQGIVTVTQRELRSDGVVEQVWLRVPPETAELYRRQSENWQARMEAVLREGVA